MCRECVCAEQDAHHATTIAAEWADDTDPQARARMNRDYSDTGTTRLVMAPATTTVAARNCRVASSLSVHAQGQVGRLPRGDGRAQSGRDPARRRHRCQDDHNTFRTTIIGMTRGSGGRARRTDP